MRQENSAWPVAEAVRRFTVVRVDKRAAPGNIGGVAAQRDNETRRNLLLQTVSSVVCVKFCNLLS